jgi:hypothetical protein
MAAERNLAKEKVELEATKRALDVVQRELEKFNRKISQRKKSSGATRCEASFSPPPRVVSQAFDGLL